MRRINEDLVASGDIADLFDYLQPYRGEYARVLVIDKFVSFQLRGEFDVRRGKLVVEDNSGNVFSASNINNIEYRKDAGSWFIDVELDTGQEFTIDFL